MTEGEVGDRKRREDSRVLTGQQKMVGRLEGGKVKGGRRKNTEVPPSQ